MDTIQDDPRIDPRVKALLALREDPAEDAGDALAIAICHLHNTTRHAVLMPKAI